MGARYCSKLSLDGKVLCHKGTCERKPREEGAKLPGKYLRWWASAKA